MRCFWILLLLSGATLVVAGYLLLSKNYITNSYTTSATSTISITCSAPAITAFVPEVLINFSPPEPVASTAPVDCKDYSMSLEGAVNGDGVPHDPSCDFRNVNGEYYVQISYPTPIMKVAGLQCRQISSASLDVHRSGPNDGVKVYFERLGAANPVHDVAEIAVQMFGREGYIGVALRDGEDEDGLRNGEIVFGGGDERSGGSKTILLIDVTNNTGDHTANVNLTFSFDE